MLCSIIGVTIRHMDNLRHYLAARDWITPKLIRHDLPGLGLMNADQAFEKPLRSSSIPPRLQEYINDFTVLIHSSPEIMPLAIDLSGPAHRRRLHR